jgi:ABC-type lipoprotein export system ATPase subunit
MIELCNVSKVYGKGDTAVTALKGININIEEGKFISIIGKSGSGKSTLMNLIGGLDSPSEGKIISDGVDITELKRGDLADYRNRTTGFIFQSFYLEPTFTVLENVAMPLTIRGEDKKVREEAAVKIINKLGLDDKTYKKANELSGGQKLRVSIARALVHNPKIILADEPTGNLDSANGAEIIKILQDIVKEGKSVVLVTHNIEDAYKADVIYEISDGVIIKEIRK